jgi:hypothetical protein
LARRIPRILLRLERRPSLLIVPAYGIFQLDLKLSASNSEVNALVVNTLSHDIDVYRYHDDQRVRDGMQNRELNSTSRCECPVTGEHFSGCVGAGSWPAAKSNDRHSARKLSFQRILQSHLLRCPPRVNRDPKRSMVNGGFTTGRTNASNGIHHAGTHAAINGTSVN